MTKGNPSKASDIDDRTMLAAVLAVNTANDSWALIWDVCERFGSGSV